MKTRAVKQYLILLITCIILLQNIATGQVWTTSAEVTETGCRAEWDRPTHALLHTPGDELFLGVIHPDAALFERPFDIETGTAEHRAYIKLLRENGVHVNTIVETLLRDTIDANGHPIRNSELDALRSFASQFIKIDTSALTISEQYKQEEYLRITIAALHPRELVKIILYQPTVHLRHNLLTNSLYIATYEMSPVMNLYFLRDQMITTARGVVLGYMNSEQRAVETKIISFVLGKLGIVPIYKVVGKGRLEGGDFIPAGDTAFIGQGLRTNSDAIRQLLENKVFGSQYVVVVKDPWKNQAQMHLDTYFNVISPSLAVLVEDRMDIRDDSGKLVKKAVNKYRCKVDVYELGDTGYHQKITDGDFQEFLEKNMGFKLITVPNKDQLKYGTNFLTIAPNRILAVSGVSEEYKQRLSNVEVTWMDFSNLTGGYGAAHCTVQILHREPY